MSNKNIFDNLEFNNLELCFDSNDSLEYCFDNNDNRDFFDKILDNNSQLIINNKEDNSLSNSNCKRGFAFSLIKSELDKTDEGSRHWVYYCSKGCHYELQKKAHVLEEKNKSYNNNKCTFYVNFQRWISDNQVYISGIIGTYLYSITKNVQMVAP
ncbi:434_t:CDS:2 [Gigaspora margarita]|uniref:434_t:CDS:1 n=1 Tax=Gigaspora margarita TaxID=4874 RepID=A0ABN7WFF3_GIGMA|nr:434_t:CDS:2 [Gigaspora margarita]